MTYKEMRTSMKMITKHVEEKAAKADLYYVICFWMSPIIDAVDHRQAYFDDFSEAFSYETKLLREYKDMKYYVASNLSSGDIDGGLL